MKKLFKCPKCEARLSISVWTSEAVGGLYAGFFFFLMAPAGVQLGLVVAKLTTHPEWYWLWVLFPTMIVGLITAFCVGLWLYGRANDFDLRSLDSEREVGHKNDEVRNSS